MATVETARGPVDSARLGTTLMHEHVFVLDYRSPAKLTRSEWGDEDQRIKDAPPA